MQSHPSNRRAARGARTLALSLSLSVALTPLIETADAAQTPTPTLATVQHKLASTSVPWVPNAGQWDARAAFRAQSFAGSVWVTTDGKLVHQFNGKKLPPLQGEGGGGDGVPSHRQKNTIPLLASPLKGEELARSSPLSGEGQTRSAATKGVEPRSAGWVLTERFVGGAIKQAPRGSDPHIGRVSFMTSETAAQAGNLPSYGQVELGEVFPGVSVTLKATNANVEKLFTVAPQHDPKQIQINLAGANKLEINAQGELIAHTGNGPVAFTAPIAFQENDRGERVAVDVAYRLVGADAARAQVGADLAALRGSLPSDAKSSPTASTYTFALGAYDTTRPLVIDPLLASTYLGGTGFDLINAMAVHPHTGQVYVVGETDSPSFPQSGSGAQPTASGDTCFVSRYSADLQQLLQSTYLGNGVVGCLAMAIHPGSGVVYVAGSATGTATFPLGSMTGAIQTSHADAGNSGLRDGFVALFSADLRTLTKATFFGGVTPLPGEQINAIAVHPHTGFVHIAGTTPSSTLPGTVVGTQAAPGGGFDAFTARLPADLTGPATSTVRYTFIGGGSSDVGNALIIDPRSGDVFVAGFTDGGLPSAMLFGAAQSTYMGDDDAFVARLKQDLSAVVRATYLGGSASDTAQSIALHPLSGEVVVAGTTWSNNLPLSAGGAQPAFGGFTDGFVSRLSADLTEILQTTYLGGMGEDCDVVCQIAIHPQSGEVFVAGATTGGLPAALVADGNQSSYGGGFYDTFIVRLNAALTARRAGTYLGGTGSETRSAIAIEPNGGSVYVAGLQDGGGFPTVDAQQSTSGGNYDGFVSRFSTDLTAVNRTPNPFSFIHQSNVPPNSTRTSNEVQIVITPTPPDNHQVAYVTGGTNSEFCVTNTAGCCATPLPVCSGFASGWINSPYEFLSGDRIAVRHTSASPSGTTETKLIISGTAYPFRSSTGNATIACNLDMNGDNVLSHTVEGLILVRAMLGFGGNAAVQGTNVTAFAWESTLRPAINEHCGTNFPFTPIL